ncbi:MAG: riboflavin synthase [Bacteroidetes bacterium]|nr:riboflavin synthase [Bacteroidota bacterium]
MFTGIVETVGVIKNISKKGDGCDITIHSAKIATSLAVDNSISVNGVCLTVVRKKQHLFSIHAVKETLLKTNLGSLKINDEVNLERAVKLSDRLNGHLVQGHIDCTGKVIRVETLETSWMFTVSFPKQFRKYIIPVGSICVDGVSLTTARLQNASFTVAIIPYTFEHTVFHNYKAGSSVNLEFDVIGKYIESLLLKK